MAPKRGWIPNQVDVYCTACRWKGRRNKFHPGGECPRCKGQVTLAMSERGAKACPTVVKEKYVSYAQKKETKIEALEVTNRELITALKRALKYLQGERDTIDYADYLGTGSNSKAAEEERQECLRIHDAETNVIKDILTKHGGPSEQQIDGSKAL